MNLKEQIVGEGSVLEPRTKTFPKGPAPGEFVPRQLCGKAIEEENVPPFIRKISLVRLMDLHE